MAHRNPKEVETISQKSSAPPTRVPAEKLVRDIRRAKRKHYSAEDKLRIIQKGRRDAIAKSLDDALSKIVLANG